MAVQPHPHHPNLRLVEEIWNAIHRADVDALNYYWDDVVWHVVEKSPWAGDYSGAQAVMEYLAGQAEWADEYNLRLDDVTVNDDRAICITHVEGKRGDTRLDTNYVVVLQLAGEKVSEVWALPMDPAAVSDFWSDLDEGWRPVARLVAIDGGAK